MTKDSIYFDKVEIEKMVIVVLFHDIISEKEGILVSPPPQTENIDSMLQ